MFHVKQTGLKSKRHREVRDVESLADLELCQFRSKKLIAGIKKKKISISVKICVYYF